MTELIHAIIAFLGNAQPDDILWIVGWGLAALFLAGVTGFVPKNVSAGLMISLGIFGTFWGISNALQGLDFSPDKMNDSVRGLLSGMTTAFYTSLLGIGMAVLSKFIWSSWPWRKITAILSSVSAVKTNPVDPVHKDMNEKLENIRQALIGDRDSDNIASQLESIKSAVAGDGDSSLSTQMQKLRLENLTAYAELKAFIGEKNTETLARLDAIKSAVAGDDDTSLATQMQKLRLENQTASTELAKRLDGIKNAVAGNDDTSLAARLQKLHEVNQTALSELIKVGRESSVKLDRLADTIREELVKGLKASMEKLTDDLKKIIADQLGGQLEQLVKSIETALIEQFGKTFVEFNSAVQALKKWQEDHRVQVEHLTAAFAETAKGIAQIRTDCAAIPDTMEQLRQIVGTVDRQIERTRALLEGFNEVIETVKTSMPELQKELERIVKNAEETAAKIEEAHTRIGESWGKNVVGIAQHVTNEFNKLARNR